MGTTVRILLLSVTILSSCAQQQKISPFTEGCMYGTIQTYFHLTRQPFPEEYVQSLYMHCEGAEGESNTKR